MQLTTSLRTIGANPAEGVPRPCVAGGQVIAETTLISLSVTAERLAMADASKQGRFDGAVVVITDAGGGQGRAEARRFASEGAVVIATHVDESGLAETVRRYGGTRRRGAP